MLSNNLNRRRVSCKCFILFKDHCDCWFNVDSLYSTDCGVSPAKDWWTNLSSSSSKSTNWQSLQRMYRNLMVGWANKRLKHTKALTNCTSKAKLSSYWERIWNWISPPWNRRWKRRWLYLLTESVALASSLKRRKSRLLRYCYFIRISFCIIPSLFLIILFSRHQLILLPEL